MAIAHSKDSVLLVDKWNLSTFLKEMNLMLRPQPVEATAFGDSGRRFLPSPSDDDLELLFLWDDGAAGPDVALAAMVGSEKLVTVAPAGFAQGDVCYGSGVAIADENLNEVRVPELVSVRANINMNQDVDRAVCHQPIVTKTATFNGASVDTDGAATSSGGSWGVHITAISATGGNTQWAVTLEDSADDAAWATVSSETYNISDSGEIGIFRSFTGNLRRYVRITVTLDASSGSITYGGWVRRNPD